MDFRCKKVPGVDLSDREQLRNLRPFDWDHNFPEVRKNGGFDIVVGNPPYYSIDKTWGKGDLRLRVLRDLYPDVFTDKTDIYYYFLHRALEISKGRVGFIVSRAFLEADKAKNIRGYLNENTDIELLFDFRNMRVFEQAGIATSIIVFRPAKKNFASPTTIVRLAHPLKEHEQDAQSLSRAVNQESFSQVLRSFGRDPWNVARPEVRQLYEKVDDAGEPLGTIAILGQGMQTGCNEAFEPPHDLANKLGARARQSILRQRARNSDIFAYVVAPTTIPLLYLEDVEKFDDLPNSVQAHLKKFRGELHERAAYQRGDCEWWKYTWPLQREYYDRPRIICPYRCSENRFSLVEPSTLGLTDTTTVFLNQIVEDPRYILGLINSKLLTFRFRGLGKLTGSSLYEYFDNSVSRLPIRRIDIKSRAERSSHDQICTLVSAIQTDIAELHDPRRHGDQPTIRENVRMSLLEVDRLVYQLYSVTADEENLIGQEMSMTADSQPGDPD